MKKLTIFDVCGTLVSINSTDLYVEYLLDQWIKRPYKSLFIKPVQYIYHFIYIIFKIDIKRNLALHYLKWLDPNVLKQFDKKFINKYQQYIKKEIEYKLISAKKRGDVILLSASINPPINLLANKYKINAFSSLLEQHNNVYTWDLLLDLLGKKEIIFEKWMIDLEQYTTIELYTDNKDDINLINFLYDTRKKVSVKIIPYNNLNYWQESLSIFNSSNFNYEFMV